ncbi:MAG: DNA polymerase Y family protein [Candidatus Korobacteraceae bacterium]
MFACIYIPDFPVEAIVRAEPGLRERAVAVLEGKPPQVRVIALNRTARRLKMEIGMTKLQASAFIGTSPTAAVLHQRSTEQEISTHAALLDVAHAFTPRVEDTAPDILLLDLSGLGRLYGVPTKMALDLAARIRAIGLEANLALAANPDAAMHAASGFSGITVIPAGEEAQRLGGLPVQVLLDRFEISSAKIGLRTADRESEKLREQILDTLERWGVRDFRALAVLPEHPLASRLGKVGGRLQRLARGAGMRTLALSEPASHFEEAMELESPVETLEPLSFVLNRLLEQLCVRLEARALAVQELHLRLQLERRVADEETTTLGELKTPFANSYNVGLTLFYVRSLRLPVSMRDPKSFLKLLQLELAAHPPGAPVMKIWITAEPAPPRTAQHDLFLPDTPDAEKLEITLARIGGIVGERRAGIARLLDAHRSGSFEMDRFVSPGEGPKPSLDLTMSDIDGRPFLALRIFRPARGIHVRLSEGRPFSLVTERKRTDRGELQLQGKILWSVGPWRSSGDWWTESAKEENVSKNQSGPWDREEWDIALAHSNGSESVSLVDPGMANDPGNRIALYRIYRDLATGHWFADASYD